MKCPSTGSSKCIIIFNSTFVWVEKMRNFCLSLLKSAHDGDLDEQMDGLELFKAVLHSTVDHQHHQHRGGYAEESNGGANDNIGPSAEQITLAVGNFTRCSASCRAFLLSYLHSLYLFEQQTWLMKSSLDSISITTVISITRSSNYPSRNTEICSTGAPN